MIGSAPVDIATVRLPGWYRPDPGRVSELAFILFSGEGEAIRMSRITNGRWVTAALGTASSAALSAADTVYCATPAWHPSTLLMSVGGAIAGGARVALASGATQDAGAFWDEVRRSGATVASYTWTMLDGLVNAPPSRASATIRCGCSSGRGCRAACGGASRSGSARARARVLRLDRDRGDPRQPVGRQAGRDGAAAPGTPEVRWPHMTR